MLLKDYCKAIINFKSSIFFKHKIELYPNEFFNAILYICERKLSITFLKSSLQVHMYICICSCVIVVVFLSSYILYIFIHSNLNIEHWTVPIQLAVFEPKKKLMKNKFRIVLMAIYLLCPGIKNFLLFLLFFYFSFSFFFTRFFLHLYNNSFLRLLLILYVLTAWSV